MKKIILFATVLFSVANLTAQTINVHLKNGQVIEYPSTKVDYVDFSAQASAPTLTPGKVVDLGLSVYWASCNLGASSPELYGNYYSWGETKQKSTYYEDNYTFYNKDTRSYIDIGNDISGTEYDAATVNLGPDWRMPTKAEMDELINNCTWQWGQINGFYGYIVTGKNGNSIFLPATGSKSGQMIISRDKMVGSATSTVMNNENVYYLEAINAPTLKNTQKFVGHTIRPVTTNINASENKPIDHSQDHLVTDKISASFAGGAYSSINGLISNGSQLMWRFVNNSSESVKLTGIQLINGSTGAEGNNMLSEAVDVSAGSSKTYTVTVGALGIREPKIKFTYTYNEASYTVEATMPQQ